jgi:hypothetical protein
LVLAAGLVLAAFVAVRDRQRRRAAQEVALAAATANYLNAKLTREVAEIAVTEYTESILKQDLEFAENEIALAKSDLARASDGLAAANRQGKPREAPQSPLEEWWETEARLAKLRLQRAQERKTNLAKTTKERTLRELNDEVQRAKADELAKKAVYEQEKVKASMMGLF